MVGGDKRGDNLDNLGLSSIYSIRLLFGMVVQVLLDSLIFGCQPLYLRFEAKAKEKFLFSEL